MAEEFNRRDFARIVGLGALSTGLGSGDAAASHSAVQEPEQTPAEKQVLPHEHLLEVIVSTYPHENLTPEIRERISAELRGQITRGQQLRQFPLDNGEAPFVFAAYRGKD